MTQESPKDPHVVAIQKSAVSQRIQKLEQQNALPKVYYYDPKAPSQAPPNLPGVSGSLQDINPAALTPTPTPPFSETTPMVQLNLHLDYAQPALPRVEPPHDWH